MEKLRRLIDHKGFSIEIAHSSGSAWFDISVMKGDKLMSHTGSVFTDEQFAINRAKEVIDFELDGDLITELRGVLGELVGDEWAGIREGECVYCGNYSNYGNPMLFHGLDCPIVKARKLLEADK